MSIIQILHLNELVSIIATRMIFFVLVFCSRVAWVCPFWIQANIEFTLYNCGEFTDCPGTKSRLNTVALCKQQPAHAHPQ